MATTVQINNPGGQSYSNVANNGTSSSLNTVSKDGSVFQSNSSGGGNTDQVNIAPNTSSANITPTAGAVASSTTPDKTGSTPSTTDGSQNTDQSSNNSDSSSNCGNIGQIIQLFVQLIQALTGGLNFGSNNGSNNDNNNQNQILSQL